MKQQTTTNLFKDLFKAYSRPFETHGDGNTLEHARSEPLLVLQFSLRLVKVFVRLSGVSSSVSPPKKTRNVWPAKTKAAQSPSPRQGGKKKIAATHAAAAVAVGDTGYK